MVGIEQKIPQQFVDEDLGPEEFDMVKRVALNDIGGCWDYPSTYAGSWIKPFPEFVKNMPIILRKVGGLKKMKMTAIAQHQKH